MSATVRITITDNDGDEPEGVFVVDHFETFGEAVEEAELMASATYARTGVIPRMNDGTPYWGESDENEVNQ